MKSHFFPRGQGRPCAASLEASGIIAWTDRAGRPQRFVSKEQELVLDHLNPRALGHFALLPVSGSLLIPPPGSVSDTSTELGFGCVVGRPGSVLSFWILQPLLMKLWALGKAKLL